MTGARDAVTDTASETPAAAAPDTKASLWKLLTARVIGFTVLGAAAAALLAVIIGYAATGEERAYTGPATVNEAEFGKICSVDVTFPDGGTHEYSFDTSRGHCESLTRGTRVAIDNGTILNTPGKDTP